jgi:hypothetical protein
MPALTPELAVVQMQARNLMDQYGLHDWTLRFGAGSKQAGLCERGLKRLTFSGPLFSIWTQDHCRNTILHEIAHALTTGHHTAEWRRVFISMGGNGKTGWDNSDGRPTLPPRFIGTCPRGHIIKKNRRDKTSCSTCNPRRFDSRYLFTWTRNPAA